MEGKSKETLRTRCSKSDNNDRARTAVRVASKRRHFSACKLSIVSSFQLVQLAIVNSAPSSLRVSFRTSCTALRLGLRSSCVPCSALLPARSALR